MEDHGKRGATSHQPGQGLASSRPVPDTTSHQPGQGLTRRRFLELAGGAVAAAVLLPGCASSAPSTVTSSTDSTDATETAATVPAATSDFIDRVEALAGEQALTLLWASDTHLRLSDTTRLAKTVDFIGDMFEVAEALKPDGILISGDLVDGKEPLDVYHTNAAAMESALITSPAPLLPVRGNHDDNSYYTRNVSGNFLLSEVVDTAWLADNLIAPTADAACVFDDEALGSCYYYRDFEKARIRFIVLDDCDIPYMADGNGNLVYTAITDFGFRSRQVEWLVTRALALSQSGWGVIVVSHVNFNDDRPYGLRGWGEAQPAKNDMQVWNILKAFKSHGRGHEENADEDFALDIDYDFSGLPESELICCLNGHTHRDQCVFIDDILNMTIRGFNDTAQGRFDAVVIDRNVKRIYTRAYDTIAGVSSDWDLGYLDGTGAPTRFNYYRAGQYVVDGMSVEGAGA